MKEIPPCIQYPTPCHKFYTEKGGELPCPLFGQNECRPFIKINEVNEDKTLSSEELRTEIREARHSLCPISMLIKREDLISDEERQIFDDFSQKLDLSKTNLT